MMKLIGAYFSYLFIWLCLVLTLTRRILDLPCSLRVLQLWHRGSLVVAFELLVAAKLWPVGPSPLISSGTQASYIGSAVLTPGPLRKSLGVVQMKEQPGRKTELVSESNLDSLNFVQLKKYPHTQNTI